jgi:hypothetical protein
MKRTATALAATLVTVAVSGVAVTGIGVQFIGVSSLGVSGFEAAAQSATTLPATTAAPTTPVTTAAPTTPATTVPVTTTTSPATTTSATSSTSTTSTATSTTTTSAGSSVSGTRIAVIVIIVVVGLVLIGGLYFLFARNRQRTQWSSSAQAVAADALALSTAVERGIPLLRNPTTAAQVWVDLNSRAARIRSGLTSLAAGAPDQRGAAATTRAAQALESLLSTIDTDRGLRMGPPPPTDEQLAYSEALLSQRSVELGRAAHDIESAAAPPA